MITLPALTWVTDELGMFVVDGERRVKRAINGQPNDVVRVAPQAWAQYDKPCETCWGLKVLTSGHPHLDDRRPCEACCEHGRQVWDVRWPSRMLDLGLGDGPEQVYQSGRATLRVVPVVGLTHACPPDLHVWVGEGRAVLCNSRGGGRRLPLDPLPTTDQYVVVVEVVDA